MTEGRFSGPFLAMVESLGGGARLQRGRRAARAGHVRQLSISSSLVTAQVRAPDEPVTRRCRIAVRAFGAAEWARVEQELAADAGHVADLLDGRVPADVHVAFARADLHPLPLSVSEVAMDCTCAGPPPCTHLAAACYAVAWSFDTDPFEVFAWRGRGRDELLDGLREAVNAGTPTARPAAPAAVGARPAADDIAAFWGDGTASPPTAVPPTAVPPTAVPPTAVPPTAVPSTLPPSTAPSVDAVLDQADPPPLTVADAPLIELLRRAYRAFETPGAAADGRP